MSSRSRAWLPAALSAAGVLLSLLWPGAAPVRAQTRASRILVDVPVVEIAGKPGITSADRVQVVNQGSSEAEVDVTVEDVGGDARGDLVAVPRGSGTGRSAAAWVTATPDNLRIASNESSVVGVKIAVPKGTAAGGYYAALTFATDPNTPPEQRPSHLLLIKIAGAGAVSRARLNGLSMPGVSLAGSVRFDLRLENIGTVHTIGSGRIVVTDLFGKRVATLRVPPVVVFPGLERV
ncbi:MAG: hypothetical protein ACRDJM_06990, partial [Actinomycetota bacterium]